MVRKKYVYGTVFVNLVRVRVRVRVNMGFHGTGKDSVPVYAVRGMVYTGPIKYISFRKNKGPKTHHSLFHFSLSLHNQLVGGRQRWQWRVWSPPPSPTQGLGTERARLGTFRGLGTERARLGTFRGFGTERAGLGTFRGFLIFFSQNEHLPAKLREACAQNVQDLAL